MIPRGKPFPHSHGMPIPVVCPWCLLVDVRFETLTPMQIASVGPGAEQAPEYLPAPYCLYRCETCKYVEMQSHLLRFVRPA